MKGFDRNIRPSDREVKEAERLEELERIKRRWSIRFLLGPCRGRGWATPPPCAHAWPKPGERAGGIVTGFTGVPQAPHSQPQPPNPSPRWGSWMEFQAELKRKTEQIKKQEERRKSKIKARKAKKGRT